MGAEIRIDMHQSMEESLHIHVRADTAEAILDKLNEAIVYAARELNVNFAGESLTWEKLRNQLLMYQRKEQKITKEDLKNG